MKTTLTSEITNITFNPDYSSIMSIIDEINENDYEIRALVIRRLIRDTSPLELVTYALDTYQKIGAMIIQNCTLSHASVIEILATIEKRMTNIASDLGFDVKEFY